MTGLVCQRIVQNMSISYLKQENGNLRLPKEITNLGFLLNRKEREKKNKLDKTDITDFLRKIEAGKKQKRLRRNLAHLQI